MSDQNWRTPTDASDYFTHAAKQAQLESRRPVINQASDLVGPGIKSTTVTITDFNDLLATFNGYYSAAPGAASSPPSSEPFVGYVISDATFGGRQVFTGLTSGVEYTRTFTRSPTDAETLAWGPWSGARVPDTVDGVIATTTPVSSNLETVLKAPSFLGTLGEGGTYETSEAGIRIRRQGVYTGNIQIGSFNQILVANVTVYRPTGMQTFGVTHVNTPVGPTFYFPFTIWTNDDAQGFSVSIKHLSGAVEDCWWRFFCTRTGDAV